MARKRRKPGNRRLWIVLVGAVLVAVIMAVAIRPGLLDRILHPGRYAVSGEARLPVGRYAEAGAAVLGGRVARLILPIDSGPIIVAGTRTAFLDPPTAHVLGVTDTGGVDGWLHRAPGGLPPMSNPAQPVDIVAAHARAQVTGGRVATIDWPTARNPDWTVTFAGGGRSVAVKVADDTGAAIAAPAR
ncbi:hypothetical protein KCP91_07190 [Microvirga sp. SRT01]|uniref:PepSY domain-containing protein n=1 Tax=Sphingomonas longa TaxID=2778730 RepID=A0ABS2D7P7_9SPHN|nr:MULTISPECIES: hypothetical protein [Alphaproteobacteria]MBM6576151.1 hypothetical protein [Sphingomonas sp. BT552]MBR7709196.1 hypothetical protein [Microvirga sp. SRT01]